ncbi:hypothetical protein BH24ACT5_BH24ACT5_04950 [soil metagenome]
MHRKLDRGAVVKVVTMVIPISTLALAGSLGGGGAGFVAAADESPGGVYGPRGVPVSDTEWCGTITMYAQEYTPNAEVANALGLTELQTAADDYTAEHECIDIEFIDDKFQDNITTIRTKAAAGNLFDIFWAQWTSFNGQLPDGVAYDLAPSMAEPSPYAPGFDTWAESMNPRIIAETQAGNGASYNVNGDWVATGWYYNKDMFEEAGITAPPTTWSEFVEVCEKLQAAGLNPVSYVPYYGWLARPFLSNIYGEDYEAIAALDGSPGFSTADEAIATLNGMLSPTDERFNSWWPAFKAATDTWAPDFITANPDLNFQAELDFQAGKSAMYFNGSYFSPKMEAANVPYEWDVFPMPSVDQGTSEFATDIDPGDTVGGPGGAFQYAISTPRANRSMEDEGKPAAVLDWLQFITAPDRAEAIINETGEFLPTFAGTQPLPQFEAVAGAIDQPSATIRVGYTSPELDAENQRIFGAYLAGQLTLEEANSQLATAMETAAQAFVEANGLQVDS